jgi:hypothetical protein
MLLVTSITVPAWFSTSDGFDNRVASESAVRIFGSYPTERTPDRFVPSPGHMEARLGPDP